MAIRKILLSTMCGLCVRVTLVVTFRVDFEGEFWGDFENDFEDNFGELLTLYVMILWLRLRCWDIYIILSSVCGPCVRATLRATSRATLMLTLRN